METITQIDFKKAVVGILAVAGTIFALGAVSRDYRDLPEKVAVQGREIQINQRAIESTGEKLDAVLCLLIQDQVAEPGEVLNPLICLNGGASTGSFLPFRPGG